MPPMNHFESYYPHHLGVLLVKMHLRCCGSPLAAFLRWPCSEQRQTNVAPVTSRNQRTFLRLQISHFEVALRADVAYFQVRKGAR